MVSPTHDPAGPLFNDPELPRAGSQPFLVCGRPANSALAHQYHEPHQRRLRNVPECRTTGRFSLAKVPPCNTASMIRHLTLATTLALAALGGGSVVAQAGRSAAVPAASVWEIGPIIRGRNYSEGVPVQPTQRRGGGIQIDLPQHPGSVHYVTFPHGSLAGKKRIVMRYRVETARGVEIKPITDPRLPSIITLYFQRAGDTWSGKRAFESHRWYATFASQTPVVAGDHQIVAPLDANWTAIQTSSRRSNPRGFAAAIAEADRVGFVLGGGDGYGHGVFATGPARLIVTEFRVE
jgi:hypothetical protein